MKFDPDQHHRHSIRARGHDYSEPGAYFVTLCAHEHKCWFGEIIHSEMKLNSLGEVVRAEWLRSTEIRSEIELDAFVIMPNHLHGIVIIGPENVPHDVGAHGRAPLQRPSRSLGSFVAGFKSATTTKINRVRSTRDIAVWQRNYYDHIIRGDDDLLRVRQYIADNPAQWELDENHPNRLA